MDVKSDGRQLVLAGLTDSREACTKVLVPCAYMYISLSHSLLRPMFTLTYACEVLRSLVTLLHTRCPNNGPASWPLTSTWHHGRLDARLDHSTRGTLGLLHSSMLPATQNFGPKRIGAGAACLTNSHSSREPSNYALATTPAPGDLLPLHASNAPNAHDGRTESTV
jgi:hypothetical protein